MRDYPTQHSEIANATRRVDKHNVSRWKSSRAALPDTLLFVMLFCKDYSIKQSSQVFAWAGQALFLAYMPKRTILQNDLEYNLNLL